MTSFFKDIEKAIEGIEGVEHSSLPPRYWYSFGNYCLNHLMSGSFFKGFPQGRITALAGPSGAGKSFLLANAIKNAQAAGAFCFVIDSENALDNTFVENVGVDTQNNYMYRSADTIPQVVKLVSAFLKKYKEEYNNDPDAPQVVIFIDSLDMLMTETEEEHFEKGDMKGDQGQRAKQLKAMLRTFVQGIKHCNIAIVVTTQVYKASQDQLLSGEGLWVVNGAIRFALSQIVLLTKLKLKGDDASDIRGIRMKCEGFKTRFTKNFQQCTIEVPYDNSGGGMDPYSGLLDAMLSVGALERKGAWYQIVGTETKFQSKDFNKYAEELLVKVEASSKPAYLKLQELVEEDNDTETSTEVKERRKAKVK